MPVVVCGQRGLNRTVYVTTKFERALADRTDDEWDWAEGQRGLALVENLSTGWGNWLQAPWADLGTHVWAEFTLDPADVPALPPYVFTRL